MNLDLTSITGPVNNDLLIDMVREKDIELTYQGNRLGYVLFKFDLMLEDYQSSDRDTKLMWICYSIKHKHIYGAINRRLSHGYGYDHLSFSIDKLVVDVYREGEGMYGLETVKNKRDEDDVNLMWFYMKLDRV